MVPHLRTSLTGPLLALEQHILDSQSEIERWFRLQWLEHTPPFYTSVDLRNAAFKLAPVDTNLFPGGFNNLNPEFLPLAVQAAMAAVGRVCPESQRFLLIPENHTRNMFYLQNVAALVEILRRAGLTVRVGSLLAEIAAPTTLDLPNGAKLTLEPIVRRGQRVGLANFDPCAVLLNNDLSAGVPPMLKDIEQPIIPPLEAGWWNRRKSHHFATYERVAEQFAKLVDIDPWLINPLYTQCGKVDFNKSEGLDCLVANAEYLLPEIEAKYRQYGIEDKPFLIIKADAGTYGMGVMTVKSIDDVRQLNRKTRTKMAVIKEGMQVHEVILQEGVPTIEQVGDATAEPVVYMMDQFVVGGFYRVNQTRGTDENLNAPGMRFEPLAFETDCHSPDCAGRPGDPPNRFYTYGVIARLAMLAASLELEALVSDRAAVAA